MIHTVFRTQNSKYLCIRSKGFYFERTGLFISLITGFSYPNLSQLERGWIVLENYSKHTVLSYIFSNSRFGHLYFDETSVWRCSKDVYNVNSVLKKRKSDVLIQPRKYFQYFVFSEQILFDLQTSNPVSNSLQYMHYNHDLIKILSYQK